MSISEISTESRGLDLTDKPGSRMRPLLEVGPSMGLATCPAAVGECAAFMCEVSRVDDSSAHTPCAPQAFAPVGKAAPYKLLLKRGKGQ